MLRRPAEDPPIRHVLMFLLLTVVWLLWSGLTVEVHPGASPWIVPNGMLIALMIGSVAVTAWVVTRMDAVDRESSPYHLTGRFVLYLPWLVKEIVLSNLHVARVILDRDLPIRPQLLRVRTTQRTDIGLVIHANSITITPGTVSLDIQDGIILVHALTDETAAGVVSGEMDRRVTWVEGSG